MLSLKIDKILLISAYTFVCVTFKVASDGENLEQYILSNWQAHHDLYIFRGISAKKDEIYIHGCVNGEKDNFW